RALLLLRLRLLPDKGVYDLSAIVPGVSRLCIFDAYCFIDNRRLGTADMAHASGAARFLVDRQPREVGNDTHIRCHAGGVGPCRRHSARISLEWGLLRLFLIWHSHFSRGCLRGVLVPKHTLVQPVAARLRTQLRLLQPDVACNRCSHGKSRCFASSSDCLRDSLRCAYRRGPQSAAENCRHFRGGGAPFWVY